MSKNSRTVTSDRSAYSNVAGAAAKVLRSLAVAAGEAARRGLFGPEFATHGEQCDSRDFMCQMLQEIIASERRLLGRGEGGVARTPFEKFVVGAVVRQRTRCVRCAAAADNINLDAVFCVYPREILGPQRVSASLEEVMHAQARCCSRRDTCPRFSALSDEQRASIPDLCLGPSEMIVVRERENSLLLVIINRSVYNECGNWQQPIKDTTRMRFTKDLKWGRAGQRYTLCGIVVHEGLHSRQGHYVAYCVDSAGRWHLYNDSTVSDCAWSDIAESESIQGDVYMLAFVCVSRGGEALADARGITADRGVVPLSFSHRGVASGKGPDAASSASPPAQGHDRYCRGNLLGGPNDGGDSGQDTVAATDLLPHPVPCPCATPPKRRKVLRGQKCASHHDCHATCGAEDHGATGVRAQAAAHAQASDGKTQPQESYPKCTMHERTRKREPQEGTATARSRRWARGALTLKLCAAYQSKPTPGCGAVKCQDQEECASDGGPDYRQKIVGVTPVNATPPANAATPDRPLSSKKCRRLRQKTPIGCVEECLVASVKSETATCDAASPGKENASASYYQVRVNPASADPRAQREKLVALVANRLRSSPTLPPNATNPCETTAGAYDLDRAMQLPKVHCAFSGCCWTGGTAAALHAHLRSQHAADLEPIANMYGPHTARRDALQTAYSEIIAHRVRRGAPLACPSIQRRCVEEYMAAVQEEDVCSPMCFMCACSFPWLRSRSVNDIAWEKPFGHLVCEKDPLAIIGFGEWTTEEVESFLSVRAYVAAYGHDDTNPHLKLTVADKEFDDWQVKAVMKGKSGKSREVKLLCCPEDVSCNAIPAHDDGHVCRECEVPLCTDCRRDILRPYRGEALIPNIPARSLCNDLMAFYPPKSIYDEGMTLMEMICCTPCITSMLCFSLEVKYSSLFDARVGFQKTRVAARGNVTSFALPWHDIMAELGRLERFEKQTECPDLPHTGEKLSSMVQVLLKVSDATTKDNLPKFIHQARVRRRVVLHQLRKMKDRGHRAYVKLDLARAEAKASVFDASDDGSVPPEIVKILPYDTDLDKMMPQKNATPADGQASSVAAAGACMDLRAPNCVTMERSSHNDVDANQIAAEAVASLSGGKVARPSPLRKTARQNSCPGSVDATIPEAAPEVYWSKLLGLLLVEGYLETGNY